MPDKYLCLKLNEVLKQIKSKLVEKGINRYDTYLLTIQEALNQFPVLSKNKKEENNRFCEMIECIENTIYLINKELNEKLTTLQIEMEGTRNFSDYELERTHEFAIEKELLKDFQNMLLLIQHAEPKNKLLRDVKSD